MAPRKRNKEPPGSTKDPGVSKPIGRSNEELFFIIRSLRRDPGNRDLRDKVKRAIDELFTHADARAFLTGRLAHQEDVPVAEALLKRLDVAKEAPPPVVAPEAEGRKRKDPPQPSFRDGLAGKSLPELFALFGEPGRSEKERGVIAVEIGAHERFFDILTGRLLDPATQEEAKAFVRFIIVALQKVPPKFLLLWVDDDRRLGRVFSEIFRDRSLRLIIRKSVHDFLNKRSQGGHGPG